MEKEKNCTAQIYKNQNCVKSDIKLRFMETKKHLRSRRNKSRLNGISQYDGKSTCS